jgi:hypothetical protein
MGKLGVYQVFLGKPSSSAAIIARAKQWSSENIFETGVIQSETQNQAAA